LSELWMDILCRWKYIYIFFVRCKVCNSFHKNLSA
jgi:hypothetical protein